MRLDIYRRPESDGTSSFLAVPEEKNIPEEAVNTDWLVEARSLEVEDEAESLPEYQIEHLCDQLAEKGYAMTALH